MTEMPYRWQKGPAWQMFELVLSAPDPAMRLEHKRAVWKSLFDGVPLADLLGKVSAERGGEPEGKPVADAGWTADAAAGQAEAHRWARHLVEDWYGEDPRVDPKSWFGNPTRGAGWWAAWERRPLKVVRRAMLRALQVSLGDDRKRKACARHDLDGLDPDDLDRNWPIELWWLCPVGTFQAAVTWRRHPPDPSLPDTGVVSVAWMTPGTVNSDDVEPIARPQKPPPYVPAPGSQCHGLRSDLKVVGGCAPPKTKSVLNPVLEVPTAGLTAEHLKRRGSWIIGQRYTQPAQVSSPVGSSALGQGFKQPNPPVTSSGKVVTVEPSWPDGGVCEAGEWGRY